MTIHIVWPNNQNDSLFRQRYAELVGETIQPTPPQNHDTSFFIIGSNNLQTAQAQILASEFQGVEYSENPPAWFIPYGAEE